MQEKYSQSANLILDRLKSILGFTRDNELAKLFDVKPQTVTGWRTRDTLDYNQVFAICESKNIDLNSIFYADRKMVGNLVGNAVGKYKNSDKYTNMQAAEPEMAYGTILPKVVTVDRDNTEVIILVAHRAAAGYLNGYADPEYIETLPTFTIPGFKGNSLRAFEVYGESMLPTHHSGSIAIGQAVENLHDIRDRRVYIIVTRNDGIVLKRVLNRIKQDGKLILISDNLDKKRYDNIVIDVEDVLELWYWRASIIRQSPEPSPLYTKLNELEAKVSLHDNYFKSKGLLGNV